MRRAGFKSLLKLLLGVGLIVYLVWAAVKYGDRKDKQVCQRVDIEVEDSTKASFVSRQDIENLLRQKDLYPVGQLMSEVSLGDIEKLVRNHPFVLDSECYKSSAGVLHIGVKQRLPVMRIMTEGADYFIDAKGDEVRHGEYAADVVVASGAVTKEYAKKYLAELGVYLAENEFWDSQIEQIYVNEDGSMDLVPRVGNHIVALGQPGGYEDKLERLRKFYKKVLSEVGWNKYERISLEYSNQIVCRKGK